MTSRGRRFGTTSRGCCPRCGAVPSHQRFRPAEGVKDMAAYEPVDEMNPVDAVLCRRCGTAFQVLRIESDGDYIVDWGTKYEFSPNFCPNCGAEVRGR